MHIVRDEMSYIGEMPSINLVCTKIESYNDICDKSNPNISHRVGIENLRSDN